MYDYTNIQWLFFFYFYCFFGWCFESTYVSIRQKKPINRGFMRGPFLPLYGSGAIMMLVVSMPVSDHLFLVYVAGCIGATVLEYVTGVVMEAIFKVRYWDYSRHRFQFQGHICLSSTIAWGGLTILMTEVIHKPVEKFVFAIPSEYLSMATILLTAVIVTDFTLSFKAALDLRDVLIRMEKGKEEMYHIMKRLDVIIALIDDAKETKKVELEGRTDEIMLKIEEYFEQLMSKISLKKPDYIGSLREELIDIRTKFSIHKEERVRWKSVKDLYRRSLILGNPTMYSTRFKEMLEELKRAAEEYVKRK